MGTGDRALSVGEEIANAITHGVGLIASIAGLPILILVAARADAWAVVGFSIFGAMLILLYAASTLYHAMPAAGRAKRVFRVLDHSAIFLLIAGTYTPFTLGPLRGAWGWSLLGSVWLLAVFGITLKATVGFRYPRLSTAVYIGMGWLVLIAIRPLVMHVGAPGLAWLLGGGLLYTGGVVFYAWGRLRYAHAVWHLFVTAGSVCHYVAVLRYAAA